MRGRRKRLWGFIRRDAACFWLLAAIPCWVSPLNGAAIEFLHHIWRTDDGLSNPMVKGVMQSRSGYLWVATDENLATFDGVRFREVERVTGPRRTDRWLVALTETSDGSVWASSINGGLCRYQRDSVSRFDREQGVLHEYVLALREDRNGQLWVGTAGGLCRFDGTKFVAHTNETGLIVEAVRAIAQSVDGKLWVGTPVGLCAGFPGREFRTYTTNNFLLNNSIMALLPDPDGSMWVGTSGGLTHLTNGGATHFTTANGLNHNVVRALARDRSGNLWVGTQGGVQVLRGGRLHDVVLREEIIPDFEGLVFIYAIAQDHEGSIWIGSNLGLSRLKPQKFHVLSRQEGLLHNLATLIFEDSAGVRWIGTYGGGVTRMWPDGRMETLTTANGLPGDSVLAVHQDKTGAVWIGLDAAGLVRWQNGRLEHFKSDDLAADTIRVIFQDSRGDLWLGSNTGASRLLDGEFRREERIPRTTVKCILEDRHGDVWFATKFGLARWRGGAVQVFRHTRGLASDAITTVFEDSQGALWAATEFGGLHCLVGDRFSPSPSNLTERILHIVEDAEGNFWMSTRNGILTARRDDLLRSARNGSEPVMLTHYARKDGMRRAQCNGIGQPAGWYSRDGRIWFPTMHGAVAFDPAKIASNHVPPPLLIEEVRINGRVVSPVSGAEFPPGLGQVEIAYTAFSFQAPERVRFQYRLEGFDSKWEDAGTRRFAQFASLPPGEYRFQVRACNNDGVWNETGASFAFTLLPHFYQSYGFYGICLLTFIGGGLALHRYRIRLMKQREAELAQLVERRTAKLQEMIRSMEGFNYSIAHDLRAPIRAIRGLTQALVEDYKPHLDEVGCDYAHRIEQSVDRMDQLIQDLLTYGQISHKEIELTAVDLNVVMNKVLQIHAEEIGAKSASVSVRWPLPQVWGNPVILEQVFLNLVGNAMKFVPRGVTPQVEVWAEEQADSVKVFVKDNGIGIQPEHQERIFRIFERLHSGENYPGTGIGLAIVHRGIERIGGRVGVTSDLNKGSCFWIELPSGPLRHDGQRR